LSVREIGSGDGTSRWLFHQLTIKEYACTADAEARPLDYMTKVPWAHLLFSEKTIMAERRRSGPHEEADNFAEIVGRLREKSLREYFTVSAYSLWRKPEAAPTSA
jgi:hypothetical protein